MPHVTAALTTPELITLMAGWGMTTPEQQGIFRRQIGAVSSKSGLTEEEIIAALGRGAPTVKAMGWTAGSNAQIYRHYCGWRNRSRKNFIAFDNYSKPLLIHKLKISIKDYGISKRGHVGPGFNYSGEVTRLAGKKAKQDTMVEC